MEANGACPGVVESSEVKREEEEVMKEDNRPVPTPINPQQTAEKLSRQTLVLNRGFLPIQLTTARHAIELLFQGRARVVTDDFIQYDLDEWIVNSVIEREAGNLTEDNLVTGVSVCIAIPKVILLIDYETIPRRLARFRRREVFSRDNYTCQYCSGQFGADQLTIDHVRPKAQGGITSWENCVTSCKSCNTNKADQTPEQAGMPLLNGYPRRPNAAYSFARKISSDSTWQKFLSS